MKNMGNYSALFLQDFAGDGVLDETTITTTNEDRSNMGFGVPEGDTNADEITSVSICGWNNVIVAIDKLYANRLLNQANYAGLTRAPRVKSVVMQEDV
jgi:hypothetical protein